MRRLPPLGSIQAFVHAARLGSIKAAADSLALSSPALTRRIQSLEQFIGTSLFERQSNSVHLNARGKAFLADIEPHIEALSSAVARVGETERMRIRIAVPSLFASQRLMPLLPELRHRHPELSIDVDTGADRIARLGEGLDAAIAITDKVDEKLYSRMLERGSIVAIGSRDLLDVVRTPADLRNVQILLHRDLPKGFDAWRTSIGMPELEPAEISYFDAGQLILDAAAGGLGIAFMLDSHLKASNDSRLVQFFGRSAVSPYAYWFACNRQGLDRKPIRIFHNWLFEQIAVDAAA
ncbi:LysR family transcriptional regulator [Sphingomonas daechungensis]|uniref:LysR family transcriptional regulator n=1 Tax=Sphingomonas daechungensis TaxID=1176646 RepID=A0ABX6T0R0_9SPHN|nr:LysR substrate-binding domain-containing protein [Sphingomonas daechungensis]QNP43429.1 LysR family transcriptional regulator [Sphingomonas daechungensis]